MSILKYKYKAHKLINTLFYVIVFVIGFILGFGTNKIDFNKLVSQVLMIDNVSATTIYTYNGTAIDEDFIYERFVENKPDFDISVYPYIYCMIYDSYAYKSNPTLLCNAFVNEKLSPDNLRFYYKSGDNYGETVGMIMDNGINENPEVLGFKYSLKSQSFSSVYPSSLIYSEKVFYTNFDKSNVSNGGNTTISGSNFKNVLDFSKYSVKLEYNENLFKDNPDFKEVCVPNNKKFGIISKEYNVDENITDETLNNRYYVDRDYIWFPNGVKGLSTFFYHNKSENNVKLIDKDDASYSMYGYWYWLNSKEEIDKYFGELPTSAMLSEAGYTDKYKYYNYTMHPFLIRYIGYEDDYMFSVFWFKELGINYIDSDVVDYPEDYCFYIKNKYDVVLFNSNEWGDLYTDITILGDKDITISTSKNESDVNNVGIFSVVNNFIYQIKGTIIFINTNIHNLFLAMPLIVRMFILSVLTVFIIKFIIDMIVR